MPICPRAKRPGGARSHPQIDPVSPHKKAQKALPTFKVRARVKGRTS
jgi:hypothetical protein